MLPLSSSHAYASSLFILNVCVSYTENSSSVAERKACKHASPRGIKLCDASWIFIKNLNPGACSRRRGVLLVASRGMISYLDVWHCVLSFVQQGRQTTELKSI